MPRACTICVHADREVIDKSLVAGSVLSGIAARYGVSQDALRRHKDAHLPVALARAEREQRQAHAAQLVDQAGEQDAREQAHALDVMEELQRCFTRVNLLFDACDRYLRDPDNPDRYDVGPRSEDVLVTYTEPGEDGKPVRRKARLSRLLAQVEQGSADGMVVDRTETKVADPRDLILKAAAQLTTQVQLLAKLLGQLDERPQVNVLMAPEWLQVRAALLTALAPYADARLAVAAALASLDAAPAAIGAA